MDTKEFTRALIESARTRKSWRERLQWVRDRLTDPNFASQPEPLAAVAVYLRFLATGELKCEEDGRHFRPNHHAEAALQIESALERLNRPATAWVLRRLYPYLPSWGEEFRRSEPLTRIRDIAHRNDIPQDLKREIKHRLQNKLHRCAGPEDLRTAEEILARITSPGASYSHEFVREFQVFLEELREFFNATALENRLRALQGAEPELSGTVASFLELKVSYRPGSESATSEMQLLDRLTGLRQTLAERSALASPQRRSQMRLADVGLEDHAFALFSECANRFEALARTPARFDWPALLRNLALALDNLRLSLIEPEECNALRSECAAWAASFVREERFHLLRVLATLSRARRLAEGYTDLVNHLFPPFVEEIGRALGVADHAVKVFSEGDIRGHLIFQLARLVDVGLRLVRSELNLPPWEAVVPGEALGILTRALDLSEVEGKDGPLVVLLDHVDGDAEVPPAVKGLAVGHPLPHLSHLGVRARQARVPFATCAGREQLEDFRPFLGKWVRLRVGLDGLSIEPAAAQGQGEFASREQIQPPTFPEVVLLGASGENVLDLDRATPGTAGGKSASAGKLLELAEKSAGLFRAPRGLVVPFGVMERALESSGREEEYVSLVRGLSESGPDELDALLARLRELVCSLPVPAEVEKRTAEFFATARLAVRSSANGEDLEHFAGAGLYDSVVNVPSTAVAEAIRRVWASLWTRRAALSRTQAGIPHERIRMAVLLQELVKPDISFILHTAHPLTGSREVVAELAVGLGETLASSATPGTPYRMECPRDGEGRLLACASFSRALRPSPEGAASWEVVDYSRVPLSLSPEVARRLGTRLASLAAFLEGELGRPQDVEGACAGDEVYLVQTRAQQGL